MKKQGKKYNVSIGLVKKLVSKIVVWNKILWHISSEKFPVASLISCFSEIVTQWQASKIEIENIYSQTKFTDKGYWQALLTKFADKLYWQTLLVIHDLISFLLPSIFTAANCSPGKCFVISFVSFNFFLVFFLVPLLLHIKTLL